MKELIQLGVGEQYPLPYQKDYCGGRLQMFQDNSNVLQIMMPQMIQSEIKALRKGDVRVGLIVDGFLIVMMFEFKAKPEPIILDCSINAKLIPNEEFTLIKAEGEERLPLQVHVIDSATGVVKGLRMFTLTPVVYADLVKAIEAQREMDFTKDEFNLRYFQWQSQYNLQAALKQCKTYPVGV